MVYALRTGVIDLLKQQALGLVNLLWFSLTLLLKDASSDFVLKGVRYWIHPNFNCTIFYFFILIYYFKVNTLDFD